MGEENFLRIKVQETILRSLAKRGFFTKYVFQGGGCLFFFYDNVRWSEDLDFVKNSRAQERLVSDLDFLRKVIKAACEEVKLLIPEVESVELKVQKASERFIRFTIKLSEKGKKKKTRVNLEVAGVKAHLTKTVSFKGVVITVEDAVELLADKIVALVARGESWKAPKARDVLDFYHLGETLKVLKTRACFAEIKKLVRAKTKEYGLGKDVIKNGAKTIINWLNSPEGMEVLKKNFAKYSTLPSAVSSHFAEQYCSQVKEYFGKKFPELVNFILEGENQCVTKSGLHLKNC